jgi:hypothetical protein
VLSIAAKRLDDNTFVELIPKNSALVPKENPIQQVIPGSPICAKAVFNGLSFKDAEFYDQQEKFRLHLTWAARIDEAEDVMIRFEIMESVICGKAGLLMRPKSISSLKVNGFERRGAISRGGKLNTEEEAIPEANDSSIGNLDNTLR